MVVSYLLGAEVMNLTSSGDYPSLGGHIYLTCTITTDNPTAGYPWSVEMHRPGGGSSDIGCITCNTESPRGDINPDCSASTSAYYYVIQCDLKDERTNLTLLITGITENEIGQWRCYYSYGQEPNAMLDVYKFGKYCNLLLIN